MGRELSCFFCFLLLILAQWEINLCYAKRDQNAPFSAMNSVKIHKGSKGNAMKKDGNEIFGAEMRKVYTGPNPLHNR